MKLRLTSTFRGVAASASSSTGDTSQRSELGDGCSAQSGEKQALLSSGGCCGDLQGRIPSSDRRDLQAGASTSQRWPSSPRERRDEIRALRFFLCFHSLLVFSLTRLRATTMEKKLIRGAWVEHVSHCSRPQHQPRRDEQREADELPLSTRRICALSSVQASWESMIAKSRVL
jgi:hypothetical protein